MNLEIKLLHQILSLAKHRNFARAAESLHISQPALSRSISNLEQTLGVQLFDRTHGGVVPTAYGRLILERGREIVAKENELQREIRLMQGIEIGELVIGAGPFPLEISVGQSVGRLIASHPTLQVRVEAASPLEIGSRVIGGGYDLAVADVRAWLDEPRLQIEPLPLHVVIFCVRPQHPLAGQQALAMRDLLAYPLVGTTYPPAIARVMSEVPGAGHIDRDTGHFLPAITVDSLSLARQITAVSDAVYPVPACIAESAIRAGELAVLDCHPSWAHSNYGFISKKDRTLSAAARKFMSCLRAVEAGTIERETALLAAHAIPAVASR